MKNILVIGPNSYIAKNFIKLYDNFYNISTLSVRDNKYVNFDFSKFDTVVYFAAIVHHPEITDHELYYKVNSNIPAEIAQLASMQGVNHFIYLSSVAAWGRGPKFATKNRIGKDTPTNPESIYGKSKLDGEVKLLAIKGIKIAIMRLPNVYGSNCPGTFYSSIKRLSKLPVFPRYAKNYAMSLISVDNVSKAIARVIKRTEEGILVPQDCEIISIQDRVKQLSGGRQIQTTIFTPFIYLVGKLIPSKYTDNLYGGYLIDSDDFEPLTD